MGKVRRASLHLGSWLVRSIVACTVLYCIVEAWQIPFSTSLAIGFPGASALSQMTPALNLRPPTTPDFYPAIPITMQSAVLGSLKRSRRVTWVAGRIFFVRERQLCRIRSYQLRYLAKHGAQMLSQMAKSTGKLRRAIPIWLGPRHLGGCTRAKRLQCGGVWQPGLGKWIVCGDLQSVRYREFAFGAAWCVHCSRRT